MERERERERGRGTEMKREMEKGGGREREREREKEKEGNTLSFTATIPSSKPTHIPCTSEMWIPSRSRSHTAPG